MLRRIDRKLDTDFWDKLSFPSSRSKLSKQDVGNTLVLTDGFSRNVVN